MSLGHGTKSTARSRERASIETIRENVHIGTGTAIESPCAVGVPPRGSLVGERSTSIGRDGVVRAFTTIYAGAVIGDRFQSGHGAMIREDNSIGDDVKIGTNAVLEPGNTIGDRVSIHSGCFLETATIEDDVFIGPNVVFVDDPHPPCPRYAECRRGALIERGAKLGANSTILPGVVVGSGSLVGAGSVVTRDVPPGSVAVGNPAKVVKKIEELECAPGFFARPYVWEGGRRGL